MSQHEQALNAVVFRAAIRQTQNAISLGSNGEGGIVQFELPETELVSLSELMKMRRAELVVTVMKAGSVRPVTNDDETSAAKQDASQPNPEANGSPSAKREKKAKPKDERPIEQRINARAWSSLIHKRGFARSPGVWDKISDKPGADDHEKMRAFFSVLHLSEIDLRTALVNFTYPSAKIMLKQAWADARKEIEAKDDVAEPQINEREESPLVSDEETPF